MTFNVHVKAFHCAKYFKLSGPRINGENFIEIHGTRTVTRQQSLQVDECGRKTTTLIL